MAHPMETESTESEKTDTESESSDSDDDEPSGSAIMIPLLKSIQARSHHCLETPQASLLQRNLIQMRIHLILGLDEPQNVVKLSTDDKTYTITIGEKNAMLGEYYIKVNDDVYLSSTTILGTIPDSIDDMIATEDSESTETESE